MSELGQSRHLGRRPTTSVLPLETDLVRAGRHVSNVPEAEIAIASFDHLVGAGEHRRRHGKPDRLGGLKVNHEFKLRWLHHG